MEEILFVTTNKGKIESAKKHITNATIIPVSLDLVEPRSDDITEIATMKADQAFEETGKPCIVLDAGFFIEELNGFPRAFVNFSLDTIGIDGIIKLMSGIENRSATFRECLVYYDGIKMEYFYGATPGSIALSNTGLDSHNQWSPLWNIFIPEGYDKTLSEMTPDEHNRRYGYTSAFASFNEYLHGPQNHRIRR